MKIALVSDALPHTSVEQINCSSFVVAEGKKTVIDSLRNSIEFLCEKIIARRESEQCAIKTVSGERVSDAEQSIIINIVSFYNK